MHGASSDLVSRHDALDRLAELWMSVLPPAIKADIVRTIDELAAYAIAEERVCPK